MKRLLFFTLALSCILQSVTTHANETILSVQKELKIRHLYNGPIDGAKGSQTSAAIRRFQIEHKLNVTGDVTDEVLTALGIHSSHKRPMPSPSKEDLALAELFSGGPFSNASPSKQRDLYKTLCQTLYQQGHLRYKLPPIDSPQSSQALRKWQRNHQLPPSGRIDAATARVLFLK